jgi:hypothetical protein
MRIRPLDPAERVQPLPLCPHCREPMSLTLRPGAPLRFECDFCDHGFQAMRLRRRRQWEQEYARYVADAGGAA